MKFTLTCQHEKFSPYGTKLTENGTKVTHEFSEISLEEILPEMESFLRGCGFYFEGRLNITYDN